MMKWFASVMRVSSSGAYCGEQGNQPKKGSPKRIATCLPPIHDNVIIAAPNFEARNDRKTHVD
jgi:hypothetical protein